jgi:serine/threonine protein kinase
MLRKGLAGGAESGESSFQETVRPTSEQPAQGFDHYELATGEDGKPVELGRGAMGVTYKAFDINLRCPVTLKVISERYLGDESARLRFLREARAAASVRHPNVASVFHLGRAGQNYFYAMEFVEGETHISTRPYHLSGSKMFPSRSSFSLRNSLRKIRHSVSGLRASS